MSIIALILRPELSYLYSFIDDSVVLKLITIFNKEANTIEEVLLEELQMFKVSDYSNDEDVWFLIFTSIYGDIFNYFLLLGFSANYRNYHLK